jgi:hypothetical protein
MTTNATPKAIGTRATPPLSALPPGSPWPTAPWTMEERLRRIEAMGQRINGYIEYMAKVRALNSTSGEAKEAAVTAFYERLVILEQQLGNIQRDLQLG